VIDLDDEGALRAGDPGGMLEAVSRLTEFCREGHRLGRGAAGMPASDGVTAVVSCGMGGSGVAGDAIRALYMDRLRVPFVVVRNPSLPAFCGPGTLVVASSYSGGTAETLACFEEAVRRGCSVIAVSSGGELAARAAELGVAQVSVPAGFMPRAAFGYLALGCIGALETIGLVDPVGDELDESLDTLEPLGATLGPAVPTSVNPAKRLAAAIGPRVPVVWGAEGFAAVAAARWKTQFNENGKVPAFASTLPELDHNEVVGWSRDQGARFFLVALRHDAEHEDVAVRFAPSIDIARSAGIAAEQVWAQGRSALAKLLSLVMIGDFTATYLGLARGEDPTPIDAIARLKQALAEA
jgi:glucose/mannose-6-phosphate isomerase